jgi:hypothetical protein
MVQIIFLIILFISFANCSDRIDKEGYEIGVKELQSDFKILRTSLEEAHPGLYWYTNKKEMDHAFDSTCKLLKKPMTQIDFLKLLLPLTASIRCAHTNVSVSNEAKNSAFTNFKCIPLTLTFINHNAFIKDDFSGKANDKIGWEVSAINGKSISEITQTLFKALPADGYNQTFKYHILEGGLFREGYALYIDQPAKFLVEVIDPSTGKRELLTIPASTKKEMERVNKKPAFHPEISVYFIDSLSAAVLRINTFEAGSSNAAYRDTLRSVFKAIDERHVNDLIIDVRNNGGGTNGNVTDLYAYLASAPFKHLHRSEMVAAHFTHINHVENPGEFQQLRKVKNSEGTFQVDYRYPGTKVREPVKNYLYKGNVIVLANGGTVSAASEFVALAKYHKRAAIIGEETGGCYYGATGGNYLILTLPASKIKVRIPAIRIFNAVDIDTVSQPVGRGVLPDVEVVPDIKSRISNNDAVLGLAINYIRNKAGKEAGKRVQHHKQ